MSISAARLGRATLCPILLLFIGAFPGYSQRDLAGTAEIKLALDKLNVLGSVLMIAAHPDDENTAVLAYYARGGKVRTGYLSCTRGEGGQNLIGSEQGDLLGLIRTQELLAARQIDGAQQFFTRAIDFGFTKTPKETFEKWGHEKILSDVVWVIRRFQPDVIIVRFSGTPRDGHGQHQASAILGKEAFTAAGDANRFPEQLRFVSPWQAKRLVWNAFSFTREQEKEDAKLRGRIEIDTGAYDPVLGKSYAEIAGISRSEHKTQGMGAAQRRGSAPNFFVPVAGEAPAKELFDGIDLTWNRVPGGDAIGRILAKAAAQFVPEHPDQTIPLLLEARPPVARLAEAKNVWGVEKLRELDEAIALCSGIWVDADAGTYAATPGSKLNVKVTAIARSAFPAKDVSVKLKGFGEEPGADMGPQLKDNQPMTKTVAMTVPADAPYSEPFWLRKPHEGATYEIDDPMLIGRPDPVPVLRAVFEMNVGGARIALERTVHFRYVDHVEGERTRPFVVVPPVAVNLPEPVVVLTSPEPRKLTVQVKAANAAVSGELRIDAEGGWQITPASQNFQLAAAGEEQDLAFEVKPPGVVAGNLWAPSHFHAVAKVGGRDIASGMDVIAYSHIPQQTIFPPSSGALRNVPLKVLARKVGYIMGAGDQVPDALRQMGCEVTLLSTADLAEGNLSVYDAIVAGVRAYNVRADIRASQQRLLEYVHNGGTLIVQYNVAPDRRFEAASDLGKLGPYPFTLSRDRVTVEEAPVAFPDPNSALLKTPNPISAKDFEGWIQERGLYFASKWDAQYQTVFESHDPGEGPMPGGMLYARYGKGVYIFTAYAWFRQLPAGVPGAYRIFANMLSAGKAAEGR